MSRGKRMTEETYNKAKHMLDKGMSPKFVSEILGIGRSTGEFIKRSADFDDYKMGRSHNKKTLVEEQAEQQTMNIQEPMKNDDDELDELRKEFINLLTRVRDILLETIFSLEDF